MKSNRPRYDVLLDQLAYLQKHATRMLEKSMNDKNNRVIDKATDDLATACETLYNDSGNTCPKDCRVEDGMCICE